MAFADTIRTARPSRDDIADLIESAGLGSAMWCGTSSGTNTITATCPGLSAYTNGQSVWLVPANTNTGAVTINLNSLGAKTAVNKFGNALFKWQLRAGQPHHFIYYNNLFYCQNTSQAIVSSEGSSITDDGVGSQLTNRVANHYIWYPRENSIELSTSYTFDVATDTTEYVKVEGPVVSTVLTSGGTFWYMTAVGRDANTGYVREAPCFALLVSGVVQIRVYSPVDGASAWTVGTTRQVRITGSYPIY